MMLSNICKVCGDETYTIKDLCLDRDGIREAQFCDNCKIIWKITSAGMSKFLIMKYPYELENKEKIGGLCEEILKEIGYKSIQIK